MNDGIVFIVCGKKAEQNYGYAMQSLSASDNRYPVQKIGQDYGAANHQASRYAKVNLVDWSDFDHFVYMDADTRAHEDIRPLFDILDDGWDIVMAPSTNQDKDIFWHVGEEEREKTFESVGIVPLQLQCGIMAIAKNEHTRTLFSIWRREWQKWSGEDQAAFIRALYTYPVKVWLMGYPWNGGAAVGHNFGAVR